MGLTIEEVADQLEDAMWITRGCRFESARRLRARGRLSLLTITVMSCYSIVLAVVELAGLVYAEYSRYFTLGSLVIAFVVLVVSLLEAGARYSLRAEALHSCGIAVSALRNQLKLARVQGTQLERHVKVVGSRYNSILAKYSDNHDPIDYDLFKLKHPEKFGRLSLLTRQAIHIRVWLQTAALYHFCIVAPIVGGTGLLAYFSSS